MSRRPKQKTTEDLAFEHKARLFYLGCANHALPLAPLPEFKDALAVLEHYDEDPTEENREWLKEVYRSLTAKKTRREYSYTAVGEFYRGLTYILYYTLYKTGSVMSSSGQAFTEAAYCAGCALRCDTAFQCDAEVHSIGSVAQQKAYEWQDALYRKLFDEKEVPARPTASVPVIDAGTF